MCARVPHAFRWGWDEFQSPPPVSRGYPPSETHLRLNRLACGLPGWLGSFLRSGVRPLCSNQGSKPQGTLGQDRGQVPGVSAPADGRRWELRLAALGWGGEQKLRGWSPTAAGVVHGLTWRDFLIETVRAGDLFARHTLGPAGLGNWAGVPSLCGLEWGLPAPTAQLQGAAPTLDATPCSYAEASPRPSAPRSPGQQGGALAPHLGVADSQDWRGVICFCGFQVPRNFLMWLRLTCALALGTHGGCRNVSLGTLSL